MTDMDDLRKTLCRGEFSSLTISWNECSSYYRTVGQLLEEQGEDECYGVSDFVGGEAERQRCIELNSIWTAQWYPDTPVGFCILHAADFATLSAALVDAAKTQEKGE